jgi:hypothetical protein
MPQRIRVIFARDQSTGDLYALLVLLTAEVGRVITASTNSGKAN